MVRRKMGLLSESFHLKLGKKRTKDKNNVTKVDQDDK